MQYDAFIQKLAKRAVIMQIGGFRPSDDPLASWFGKVNVAAPGESWPMNNEGQPMHALCQLNIADLPFRPPGLDDIEMLTVFIGPDRLPSFNDPNGSSWCLRAYTDRHHLIPLAQAQTGSGMKSLPMRPQVLQQDYPGWEDVAFDAPNGIGEKYYDMVQINPGFKLGGWPSLIQSGIGWQSGNTQLIRPEYVFQIDTTEKGNWMWGDNGTGYFGRGTCDGHKGEWAISWQCY